MRQGDILNYMAGANIQIQVDDAQLLAALDNLIKAGTNMTPMFADIGEHLLLSHAERFDRQVDPDGVPWEPLSDAYQARKPKNADKILVLDDYLRGLLAYNPHADELEFGSNRVYAATHQFGDESRGIPARPFLGVSDEDGDEIIQILRDWRIKRPKKHRLKRFRATSH